MNNPFTNIENQNAVGNQSSAADGVSWWFKWLIKIISVVLGLLGLILGILTAISTSLKCIIAGIILM